MKNSLTKRNKNIDEFDDSNIDKIIKKHNSAIDIFNELRKIQDFYIENIESFDKKEQNELRNYIKSLENKIELISISLKNKNNIDFKRKIQKKWSYYIHT